MTITYQNYLWCFNPQRQLAQGRPLPSPGEQFSIFVGPYGEATLNDADRQGEVLTEPNLMREDHFVVIDDFGSTAGVAANWVQDPFANTTINWVPNGFVQIAIDNVWYYQNPEDIKSWGISGDASPFPKDINSNFGYLLEPNIYVKPFETWDVRYVMTNQFPNLVLYPFDSGCFAQVYVTYWEFSGSDSLICEKLVQLGIEVTVDNVEWFRRELLLSRGLDTNSWEWYLEQSQTYWRNEQEKQQKPDAPKIVHQDKRTKRD
jgi:hypothetical protein